MNNTFRPDFKGKNRRTDGEASTVELPHSEEAEQRLVGTILKENNAFDDVFEIVKAADFHDAMWRSSWEVIADRLGRGEKATPILVSATFPTGDGTNGTVLQLLDKACTVASTVNAVSYAKLIRDLAENRRTHALCTDWAHKALDKSQRETLSGLRTAIEVASDPLTEELDPDAAWEGVWTRAAALYETGGESLAGIKTGVASLDALVPPMRDGNSIILAGVTGNGKTTLALQIAYNAAKDGNPTVFFSLEMTGDEVREKLAAMAANVKESDVDRGALTDGEMRDYLNATKHLQAIPLFIIDKKPMKPSTILARCRRLSRTKGLKFVVIDYLGKMTPDGRTNGIYEKMTDLSNEVKRLAGELRLPILCLAQLNREIYKRPNKKPVLADLRGSGDIEQDADTVLFVQKVQAMIELDEPSANEKNYQELYQTWQAQYLAAEGQTMVYLSKHRRTGKIGSVELKYNGRGLFADAPKTSLTYR